MKIRINDKSSNNIAECDLLHYDTGVWHVQQKVNIAKVFGDLKQSDKEFEDYIEVIDINIDNLISPKKLSMIKSIASAWAVFETIRNDYGLWTSDDEKYTIEIINIPHIYGYITDDEHKNYVKKIKDFFGYDGDFYTHDYTYEELDDFIQNLNPIYKK